LLALIILPIGFYTSVRFLKLMDIGPIIRYELLMVPYIVLISLIGLFSISKKNCGLEIVMGYALIILPGFLLNGFSYYAFGPVPLALGLIFFPKIKNHSGFVLLVLFLGTLGSTALAVMEHSEDYRYQEAIRIVEWVETNNATNFYYNNNAVAYVGELAGRNAKYYIYFRPSLVQHIPEGSLVIHAKDINEYDWVWLLQNESLFEQVEDYGEHNFAVFRKN
jgi:hypothetical protein